MPPSDLVSSSGTDDYTASSPYADEAPASSDTGAKVNVPEDFVPCINEDQFSRLIVEGRRKPSPNADSVFPWLHGITKDNRTLPYLFPSMKTSITAPKFSAGLLLVVSMDNYWETTSLRGTVHVSDILETEKDSSEYIGQFIDRDLTDTINIRNFEIQCSKYAQICDIIVYVPGLYDEGNSSYRIEEAFNTAKLLRKAQVRINSPRITLFYPNTLFDLAMKLGASMSSSMLLPPMPYSSVPSSSPPPRPGPDQCWDNMHTLEYHALIQMAAAVPIQPNIWTGSFIDIRRQHLPEVNDPAIAISPSLQYNYEVSKTDSLHTRTHNEDPSSPWSMVIECQFACSTLPTLSELDHAIRISNRLSAKHGIMEFSFPGTSSYAYPNLEAKHIAQIVNLCHLIYIRSKRGNILLASEDGHRASSVLVLIYIIYCTGATLEGAILYLHSDLGRPLSLSGEDMNLLKDLQYILRLMGPSSGHYHVTKGAIPVSRIPSVAQALAVHQMEHRVEHQIAHRVEHQMAQPDMQWAIKSKGSLPSRILPHLYLGSYAQATNVEMLKALGIQRLVSLGDCPLNLGASEDGKHFNSDDFELVLKISNFRDNGMDDLKNHLHTCLALLADSEAKGILTFVHCQQGVSRSAAICIAEVMRSTGMCLPEAYIWTRVHRLDVIIQPNLRLMYDLLKFEEEISTGRSIEWPVFCREVASLNREYAQ